uniref:Uncharacterized protein n=1 Tax=Clytia hemisphaerica TaxID=252671 RepID=A0A7M5XLE7_9CNID
MNVFKSRLPFVKKIPLLAHTSAFNIKEIEDIQKFFEILKSVNVKSLIIDHKMFRYIDSLSTAQWSIEQFKMFAENFKIDALSIDSLAISAGNVKEFIHTIATIENLVENCRIFSRT